jgi:hypothetical protein
MSEMVHFGVIIIVVFVVVGQEFDRRRKMYRYLIQDDTTT